MAFDIVTLHDFEPPCYRCAKCLALLPRRLSPVFKDGRFGCPARGVVYLPTKDYYAFQVNDYLKHQGLGIEFEDVLSHTRKLARAAKRVDQKYGLLDLSPLGALYSALGAAECFVHFVTFGISYQIIGALKLIAHRVDVRGVVSNVGGDTLAELTEAEKETPPGAFKVKVWKPDPAVQDAPHQKLLVIDGLLAFKGSANLTIPGWRKAAQHLEIIDAVSDVEAVIDLHNRYFSPVWAQFGNLNSTGDFVATSAK